MSKRPSNRNKLLLRGETLSNSSSRSASRARTPTVDGEENGSLDVNFQSIEELLTSKLESLQSYLGQQESVEQSKEVGSLNKNAQDYKQRSANQLNKLRVQSGTTSINDIIYSLSMSRTEVSSQSREMLLAQLYKLVVSKPLVIYNEEHAGTDNYVSTDKISQLIKIFLSGDYRSASEFLLLFRSIIALIASDIEEFGTLVTPEFLGYIEKLIHDPPNNIITNENKSSLITGLSGLLLILYNGSSNFGIDERINWLVELSEGYSLSSITLNKQIETGEREYSTVFDESDDKKIVSESLAKVNAEASVAISGLHASGCLLTLMTRGGYLNEFITDLMPKLINLVDNDENFEIAKAAGRVIALCYELYTYEEVEEELTDVDEYNYNSPYYEQGPLFSIIERLANISSKKLSKKDKKKTHSIFRDVLNTLTSYTNPEKRIEIYKRSPEGLEIINSLIDSTYIKLSKTRSLPINSWFLYLRLIHLKWCFSFGVHNQLVSNDSIKDILKEAPSSYQLRYGMNDTLVTDDSELNTSFSCSYLGDKFATDDKKRTEIIRKARFNKLTEEIENLQID